MMTQKMETGGLILAPQATFGAGFCGPNGGHSLQSLVVWAGQGDTEGEPVHHLGPDPLSIRSARRRLMDRVSLRQFSFPSRPLIAALTHLRGTMRGSTIQDKT